MLPGEIGHFKHHHAVDTDSALSAADARSVVVTGLGFIAGYRARAVKVGAHGRCKVVDFERLNVLREWHVNGPVTVLSVLTLKEVEDGGSVVL